MCEVWCLPVRICSSLGHRTLSTKKILSSKLSESDPQVQDLLAKQDQVLLGSQGSRLLSVNIDTGQVENEVDLRDLPTWDGLAGADGHLFLTTLEGSVICFGESGL